MHLDMGLPLLSELEQLRRAFWQNYDNQNHFHNQDNALELNEQTHCSQPQRQSPDLERHSDSTNNHMEPNHLTQSTDQTSTFDSYADGQQHTDENHEMTTEQDHLSSKCNTHSQDKSQTCSKSKSPDSSQNGSKTYEHSNSSEQPKTQHEPSQPLQVNNTLLDQSSSLRRACSVLWDKTSEDSSFL